MTIESKISALQRAMELMNESLELIKDGLYGTNMEDEIEDYTLNKLENLISSGINKDEVGYGIKEFLEGLKDGSIYETE